MPVPPPLCTEKSSNWLIPGSSSAPAIFFAVFNWSAIPTSKPSVSVLSLTNPTSPPSFANSPGKCFTSPVYPWSSNSSSRRCSPTCSNCLRFQPSLTPPLPAPPRSCRALPPRLSRGAPPPTNTTPGAGGRTPKLTGTPGRVCVINPSPEPVLARLLPARIAIKAFIGDKPPPNNDEGAPMCLSYHLRDGC
jgi:hypothetical protein